MLTYQHMYYRCIQPGKYMWTCWPRLCIVRHFHWLLTSTCITDVSSWARTFKNVDPRLCIVHYFPTWLLTSTRITDVSSRASTCELVDPVFALSAIFIDYLPAHVLPMYPAGQVHVNLLTPSLHCPPFWHGLLAHSLTSIIKKNGKKFGKIYMTQTHVTIE